MVAPKSLKLTSRRQYRQLNRQSDRFVGSTIIVDTRENRLTHSRMGITVTRRYGKAHQRNRFKRQVREAFRACYPQLSKGVDLNIRPRFHAHFAKTQNIVKDLIKLLGVNVAAQP